MAATTASPAPFLAGSSSSIAGPSTTSTSGAHSRSNSPAGGRSRRSSHGAGAAAAASSSSNALAAFDLPSMPGSYEDFDFSLDLPDNILPSDLNLVTSPEFSQLFGLRSGSTPTSSSMLPSSSLMGMLSPGATGLTPTPGFSWKTSAPPTPRNVDATASEDTVMAGASTSGAEGQTPTKAEAGGFPFANISSDPMTTSTPNSQILGGSQFMGQPPPAPFSPPPGGNLFGFNDGATAPGLKMSQQHQPQQQTMMPFGQGPPPPQPQGLFNANESNFLSNFLSNFDGWDFNPSLPMQMPSFAEAEKNAFQFGIPTPPQQQQMPNFYDGRRGSRRSGSGASTIGGRSKASPRGQFGPNGMGASPSYRMDASAGAAFGRPMEDFDDNDEDELDQHDYDHSMADGMRGMHPGSGVGKKAKTEHGVMNGSMMTKMRNQQAPMNLRGQASMVNLRPGGGGQEDSSAAVPEAEKRQNHILSEQRRRGHIREAFKELVDMLEAGREFGARGLGLSSGAGTGIEDEGLDDRSDYESTLEEEGPNAAAKRRKAKAKRKAALEAARKAGAASGQTVSAALVNGGGGRGKGRGRGGSAGGGAGSKSAVLFQAVDLLHWLEGRNKALAQHVEDLEGSLVMQPAA